MAVLVTGGAGYIGSHMVRELSQHGENVIIVDDLSSGRREAVDGVALHVVDIHDGDALDSIFSDAQTHGDPVDVVMHFASRIEVGESVREPGRYYHSIVGGSLSLFEAMRRAAVSRLVFSSTAAVYGEPTTNSIGEDHDKRPLNPYGRAKWTVECMLRDFATAFGFSSIALRYFNAAGASPQGSLGECHNPETHLIPLVLQLASGRRTKFSIFGDDYPTDDGTCVRDFIHVADLCAAHRLALLRLRDRDPSYEAFNLGNGTGFSVKQVIEAAEQVTGVTLNVATAPRRAGDPAVLVADSSRAKEVLGWQPRLAELKSIIEHAWAWEQHLAV